MNFKQRLNRYFIGLGLGTLVSIAIFGKSCSNTAWAPGPRVKLRLKSTLVKAAPAAQHTLDEAGLTLADLRAGMDSMHVDFGHSRMTDDSLFYQLNGTVNGHGVAFVAVALRNYEKDSTATLINMARTP